MGNADIDFKRNAAMWVRAAVALAGLALATACDADGDGDETPAQSGGVSAPAQGGTTGASEPDASTGAPVGTTTTDDGADGTAGDTMDPESPVKLDVGQVPDAPDFSNCGAPSPVVCDDEDDDMMHALGLNCDGGPQLDGVYTGGVEALYIHEGNLGTSVPAAYPPREGDKVVILSTGIATEILTPGAYTSTGTSSPDPGFALPAPLNMSAVSPFEDCAENPALIGTGDCSNTLAMQWSQGQGANDYVEIRINAEVPAETFAFSYEFAFFSEEYPDFFMTQYNDMYVAWLESEQWTGNISFDEAGNPISLNAGFLDNLPGSPELIGTSMSDNAGTKWLVSTAGVTPGEDIEIVFALWDLSDDSLDTVVMLDNWQWGCEGGPPITIPG